MQKDTMMRGDREFKKFLEEIKLERMKKGLDKRPLSDRRLTLAIRRIPGIKDVLLDANISNQEKKIIKQEMGIKK